MSIITADQITVMNINVDRGTFGEHRKWLQHHCPDRWRVRYMEQTGIRTVVAFDDTRDKFLFEIAWANDIMDVPGDIAVMAFRRHSV